MNIKDHLALKLAVSMSAVMVLCAFGAAQPAATGGPKAAKRKRHAAPAGMAAPMAVAPAGPSAASRLDRLSSEVGNLESTQTEASNEVKKIQEAIAVAPPPAGAQPQTIGQHVSTIETALSDTRKNLAENLGVHIHGLVDAAYGYNINRPNSTGGLKGGSNSADVGGRVNQLRVFDQDANGFQLTQFNLHVDRQVEGGVGFVTDLNFGKTAEVVRSATRYSSSAGFSTNQFDATQAYVTYTVPVGKGINLSAGKFVTLLGAEVIPTYNNLDYNESKSLLFGFAIPFTHTGVRAQYSFSERVGLTLGINNGWDAVSNNNNGQTMEGQLALTPSDSFSLLLNGIFGPEQVNHGNSKRGVFNPVVTWKTPLSGLTLIGDYDYGHEDGPVSAFPAFSAQGNSLASAPPGAGGSVTIPHGVDWQGFAGYVVYDVNEKIELATRGEYFRDSDGARTGLRQSLGEITETLNYKLAPGLLARLEYRHDESSAKPFFSNNLVPAIGLPSHTLAGQDTLGVAAIYSF